MGSGLAAHPDSSLGLLLEILWEVIAVTWCVTLPLLGVWLCRYLVCDSAWRKFYMGSDTVG